MKKKECAKLRQEEWLKDFESRQGADYFIHKIIEKYALVNSRVVVQGGELYKDYVTTSTLKYDVPRECSKEIWEWVCENFEKYGK